VRAPRPCAVRAGGRAVRVLDQSGKWQPVTTGRDDEGFTVVAGSTIDPTDPVFWGLGSGDGAIRLTDGPGGMARYVNHATICRTNSWLWSVIHLSARGQSRLPLKVSRDMETAPDGLVMRERVLPGRRSAAE